MELDAHNADAGTGCGDEGRYSRVLAPVGHQAPVCLDTEREWAAFPRRGAVSGKLAGVRKEAGMNNMKVMVMWKTEIAR